MSLATRDDARRWVEERLGPEVSKTMAEAFLRECEKVDISCERVDTLHDEDWATLVQRTMKRRYWQCAGPWRGYCGHMHRSVLKSVVCCEKDRRAQRKLGSVSDRKPQEVWT